MELEASKRISKKRSEILFNRKIWEGFNKALQHHLSPHQPRVITKNLACGAVLGSYGSSCIFQTYKVQTNQKNSPEFLLPLSWRCQTGQPLITNCNNCCAQCTFCSDFYKAEWYWIINNRRQTDGNKECWQTWVHAVLLLLPKQFQRAFQDQEFLMMTPIPITFHTVDLYLWWHYRF